MIPQVPGDYTVPIAFSLNEPTEIGLPISAWKGSNDEQVKDNRRVIYLPASLFDGKVSGDAILLRTLYEDKTISFTVPDDIEERLSSIEAYHATRQNAPYFPPLMWGKHINDVIPDFNLLIQGSGNSISLKDARVSRNRLKRYEKLLVKHINAIASEALKPGEYPSSVSIKLTGNKMVRSVMAFDFKKKLEDPNRTMQILQKKMYTNENNQQFLEILPLAIFHNRRTKSLNFIIQDGDLLICQISKTYREFDDNVGNENEEEINFFVIPNVSEYGLTQRYLEENNLETSFSNDTEFQSKHLGILLPTTQPKEISLEIPTEAPIEKTSSPKEEITQVSHLQENTIPELPQVLEANIKPPLAKEERTTEKFAFEFDKILSHFKFEQNEDNYGTQHEYNYIEYSLPKGWKKSEDEKSIVLLDERGNQQVVIKKTTWGKGHDMGMGGTVSFPQSNLEIAETLGKTLEKIKDGSFKIEESLNQTEEFYQLYVNCRRLTFQREEEINLLKLMDSIISTKLDPVLANKAYKMGIEIINKLIDAQDVWSLFKSNIYRMMINMNNSNPGMEGLSKLSKELVKRLPHYWQHMLTGSGLSSQYVNYTPLFLSEKEHDKRFEKAEKLVLEDQIASIEFLKFLLSKDKSSEVEEITEKVIEYAPSAPNYTAVKEKIEELKQLINKAIP